MTKKNYIHDGINVLKVLSIFGVILFHVSLEYGKYGNPGWLSSMTYTAISRYCVPVFFMISGAMILGKNDTIKEFFIKRINKIFIPLVAWSLIYYFFFSWILGNDITIKGILISLLVKPAAIHLWFLYAIIGFYLIALMYMYIREDKKKIIFAYYTSIWFLIGSLVPFIRVYIPSIPWDLGTPYFYNETYQLLNYSGYFIAGYLLLNVTTIRNRSYLSIFTFIASAIAMLFLFILDSTKAQSTIQYAGEFRYPLSAIMAFSIFFLFANKESFHNKKISNIISKIADVTFGIYLCHVIIITGVVHFIIPILDPSYAIVYIPLLTILIFICGYCFTSLIKKVYFLKRIV
ncbi:acyltransferase [Providencia rustigianii]|uniref:acyltransferase n=3 Tax=Providencia rustigianii TaxID=158850 RepID=UPI00223F0C56|nr:acyltransferase family protein [Providencia rustigianii]